MRKKHPFASVGPPLDLIIYYTDGGSAIGGIAASNGGWRCSLDSWLEDNPSNLAANIRVYPRGDGVEEYGDYDAGQQTFRANRWASSTVSRVPAGNYERRFSDGSVEVYGSSDGASSSPRRWFLTEFHDAWGNGLTFQYDGTKLTSCIDAAG